MASGYWLVTRASETFQARLTVRVPVAFSFTQAKRVRLGWKTFISDNL